MAVRRRTKRLLGLRQSVRTAGGLVENAACQRQAGQEATGRFFRSAGVRVL